MFLFNNMATALPSEDGNIEGARSSSRVYVCPICLESVKTPRSLPCLHTFCEDCLHTYITAAVGKAPGDVACPVCRKQIMAPEPGLTHDKWAKSFPINYYLSASFLTPDVTDVKTDTENCRVCERSNKLVPAEHYCQNCVEAVCDACKSLHQNFQILKNHTIVTLEYFRNNPCIPGKDEICQHHPSNVVEVYCLDHSKMCCSVCFATQHRHCKDVKSLEECAELLTEDVFKDITSNLESLMKSIDGEIEGKEKVGEKLKKCKEGALVKMTQSIEAAKKNLDILLQMYESEIDRLHSSNDTQLKNVLKVLQGIKTSVVGDRQMLETAYKYGSKTQVFVTLEKARIQIGEQLNQVSDVASKSIREDYSVDFKKVDEICTLKSIASVRPVSSSSPVVAQRTLDRLTAFSNPSNFLLRQRLLDMNPHVIKWVEKLTYQLPGICYGATFLGRKVAIAVSRTKEIVVLKEDCKEFCRHSIPYSANPADINVSTSDENKVFISFRMNKILKKYHVDGESLTELSTISFQHIVEGFCIFDDQIVHASKDCIFLSDMDGETRKIIQSKYQGDIRFLVGCPNQRMFYYTDSTNLCFRKLDAAVVSTVPLSNYTRNTRGIGIDFQGNVYVCCYDSYQLLQISHKNNNVIKALEIFCYNIAFHPDGMSFVVMDTFGNMRFYTMSIQ